MFRSLFNKVPVWQGAGEGTASQAPAESSTDAPAQSSLLSSGGAPATGETNDVALTTDKTDQTGGTAKPSDGTPGGESKTEDTPPAAFDIAALTLPDGVVLDEAVGKSFTELLNDTALSPQERGQKLFDLYSQNTTAMQTATQEAQVAAWAELNNTWRAEVDALPEFKGKVDVELGAIKQVLTGPDFKAPKEFFSALDLTGAGNNPHILSMLHKLTAPYREGKPVVGDAAVQAGNRLAGMYPTMNK